jgi:purine-nucleoside phosphorylase
MMMGPDDAIITPIPGKHPKSIGIRCAMVGHPLDAYAVCLLADLSPKNSRRLLLSRLYYTQDARLGYSIIGPFVGAPYAVMLLETAVAWGVNEIVFFGWCGAVSSDVHIGDIIVPDLAYIDEGTSRNYTTRNINKSRPSSILQNYLKKQLSEKDICFHEGPVWTTDAIYRETFQKIIGYQNKSALGVDMETSALFSAGLYRNISVGCILAVSDEVSTNQWIQGFNNSKFKESRNKISRVICNFLKNDSSIES